MTSRCLHVLSDREPVTIRPQQVGIPDWLTPRTRSRNWLAAMASGRHVTATTAVQWGRDVGLTVITSALHLVFVPQSDAWQ